MGTDSHRFFFSCATAKAVGTFHKVFGPDARNPPLPRKAKNIIENIGDVFNDFPLRRRRSRLRNRLIIFDQEIVGFGDDAELMGGRGVIRIPIRVMN